jgi:hypothetical protein
MYIIIVAIIFIIICYYVCARYLQLYTWNNQFLGYLYIYILLQLLCLQFMVPVTDPSMHKSHSGILPLDLLTKYLPSFLLSYMLKNPSHNNLPDLITLKIKILHKNWRS